MSGWWLGASVTISAIALLVACASGEGASTVSAPVPGRVAEPAQGGVEDKLRALIEAARQEGELILVWGENTAGGKEAVERWNQGFNRAYGLNITFKFTPGPSMPDVAARIAQEYQAGRPAVSDVYIGSEAHIAALIQANVLEPVDWLSWAPNIQNPELLATPDGVAVEIASRTPGISYHTRKFTGELVPRSLQDLLRPAYKGRIASTPYAAFFDRLASPELWGEQRTVEYVTKLADQIAGLMRCGEFERIASGEFDAMAIDCGAQDALKMQERGVPIAQVIPSDAAAIVYWYMAVPKNALHPNAAKLFINYILSREAQDILYDADRSDHYLLDGSRTRGPIQQLQAAGVRFVEVDVAFVQRNDEKELSRVREQLQRILQRR